MYIYISMVLSFGLCLTGVILSIIDVNKYNFGLYLALLSIVTFTVALACLVVKPTLCRGPICLTKLLRWHFGSNTHSNYGMGSNSNSFRRILFCHKKNPSITEYTATTVGMVQSVIDESFVEESKNNSSSTADAIQLPKKIRFVDEVDMIHEKAERRGRAWTAPSSCLKKDMRHENKSLKQWQRLILRHDNNLLIHSAFPLCERGPICPKFDGVRRQKSYSTEEVVDLRAFCRPETLNLTHHNKPLVFSHSTITGSQNGPIDKCSKSSESCNKLQNSPWKRSHTIVVKYVPVRKEWLRKQQSSSTSSDFERERSQSSVGVSSERTLNNKLSNQIVVHKTNFFPQIFQMDPFNRISSSKTETFL